MPLAARLPELGFGYENGGLIGLFSPFLD
jgi:hypothetical protein